MATFFECLGLMRVILPDTVEMLGAGAFYGCTALCDISLGEGLRAIGESAFEGCSALEKITLPEGLEALGGSAFMDCGALRTLPPACFAGLYRGGCLCAVPEPLPGRFQGFLCRTVCHRKRIGFSA